jgi:hypothetical protein
MREEYSHLQGSEDVRVEARVHCFSASLRLDGFECPSSPDLGYIQAEMSDTQIDNDDVDQVKLFQLFVLFGGDTKRTSLERIRQICQLVRCGSSRF